jgi:hypothetical protein
MAHHAICEAVTRGPHRGLETLALAAVADAAHDLAVDVAALALEIREAVLGGSGDVLRSGRAPARRAGGAVQGCWRGRAARAAAVPGAGIGADSPGVPRLPPLEPERPDAGADGFVALEPGPEEAGADGFGVRLEPGSAEPAADGLVTVLEGLELVPGAARAGAARSRRARAAGAASSAAAGAAPLDCARAAPESARAATIASAWVRMAVLHVL